MPKAIKTSLPPHDKFLRSKHLSIKHPIPWQTPVPTSSPFRNSSPSQKNSSSTSGNSPPPPTAYSSSNPTSSCAPASKPGATSADFLSRSFVTSFPPQKVLLYDILSCHRLVGFRTRFGEDSDNFVANSGARLLLKMTCRLARQVVFEVWKREIGGIEVASNRIVAKASDEVLWSEIAVKRRREAAEGLDMLIRATEQGFIRHGFGEKTPMSECVSTKRPAEEAPEDEPSAKRQRLSSTSPILVLRGACVEESEEDEPSAKRQRLSSTSPILVLRGA